MWVGRQQKQQPFRMHRFALLSHGHRFRWQHILACWPTTALLPKHRTHTKHEYGCLLVGFTASWETNKQVLDSFRVLMGCPASKSRRSICSPRRPRGSRAPARSSWRSQGGRTRSGPRRHPRLPVPGRTCLRQSSGQ